jgi:hypothetical protein
MAGSRRLKPFENPRISSRALAKSAFGVCCPRKRVGFVANVGEYGAARPRIRPSVGNHNGFAKALMRNPQTGVLVVFGV